MAEDESYREAIRQMWIAGDFIRIARLLTVASEEFVGRLGIAPGMSVLDLACGAGGQAIPATRLGARVVGVDLAPNLLHLARVAASRAKVQVRLEEADITALPFAGDSFDVVYSMFGAMYAHRPDLVASEMLRVCRPGGVIAMATWPPDSFLGEGIRRFWRYMPLNNLMAIPAQWGVPSVVRERFGDRLVDLSMELRPLNIQFPLSLAEAAVEYRKAYAPAHLAWMRAGDDRPKVEAEIMDLLVKWNRSTSSSITRLETHYLEIRGRRRRGV